MKRGELYRVPHPTALEPKRSRVFAVVSRQVLIDSRFSTVVCAPVYTSCAGLATEVEVGPDEGLKHRSCIHGDALVSLPKTALTDYVGCLPPSKMAALRLALLTVLDLEL